MRGIGLGAMVDDRAVQTALFTGVATEVAADRAFARALQSQWSRAVAARRSGARAIVEAAVRGRRAVADERAVTAGADAVDDLGPERAAVDATPSLCSGQTVIIEV